MNDAHIRLISKLGAVALLLAVAAGINFGLVRPLLNTFDDGAVALDQKRELLARLNARAQLVADMAVTQELYARRAICLAFHARRD